MESVLEEAGLQEIKINIMDNSYNLIETPVRGVDCHHADVFELRDIATNFAELRI